MKFTIAAAALLGALAVQGAMFKDGDRVAFIGDSITHGGTYHRFLADYYLTRFPRADIRLINCGSGGDTSGAVMRRLEKDVIERKPNAISIMFGMNDFGFREYGADETPEIAATQKKRLEEYAANMGKLVERLKAEYPAARFLLATPTPFDDTATFPDGKKVNEHLGANAGLGECAGIVRKLAAANGAELVDFHTALNSCIRKRRLADPYVTFASDRIHPCSGIHLLMALTYLEAQNADRLVSDVAFQHGRCTKQVKAQVTEVKADASGGLSFTMLEECLPMPFGGGVSAFTNLPQVVEFNQQMLTFYGLPAGNWTLKIDGAPVHTATEREWELGVNMAFNPKTPQFRQAHDLERANHRRADRHSMILAARPGVRRHVISHMKRQGLDPDKAEDRAKFLAERLPKLQPWDVNTWKGAFAEWEKQDELVAGCENDWAELRKTATPKPHKYELVKR